MLVGFQSVYVINTSIYGGGPCFPKTTVKLHENACLERRLLPTSKEFGPKFRVKCYSTPFPAPGVCRFVDVDAP